MDNLDPLVDQIASADNWKRSLAGAVSGGIAYAVAIGAQAVTLTPGRALREIADKIGGAYSAAADRVGTVVEVQAGQAWTLSLDLGLISLPYALVTVLIAFGVTAWLITTFWRGS
jgi:hypothetical protein